MLKLLRRRSRSTRWLAPTVAGLALLAAGGAWAESALTQAEISVCLDARGYLYQPQARQPCPGGSLSWAQQGPPGQQGEPGPMGPQGSPAPVKVVRSASYYRKTTPNPKDQFPTQHAAGTKCPDGWIAIAGTWANGDPDFTSDDAGFRVRVPNTGFTVHGARLEGFKNGKPTAFVVYYRWQGKANRSFVDYLVVQVTCQQVAP